MFGKRGFVFSKGWNSFYQFSQPLEKEKRPEKFRGAF